MIHYQIHDLASVIVEDGVSSSTRRAVEFQLGQFRTDETARVGGHIDVRGYHRLEWPLGVDRERFHLSRGIPGSIIDVPDSHVALQRTSLGWCTYADRGDAMVVRLVQDLALRSGVTFIHAAGVVSPSGRATLFPGAGGVGKTAILGSLVKDHGWRLLGDDVIGLSRGAEAWAFPRPFVLKDYHRDVYPEVFARLGPSSGSGRRHLAERWRPRIIRFLLDNLPLLGVTRLALARVGLHDRARRVMADQHPTEHIATVPVAEIFGIEAIASSAPVERIVFLARHEGTEVTVRPLSETELVRRLHAIIHHEWQQYDPVLHVANSLGLLDHAAYTAAVIEVLTDAVAGAEISEVLVPAEMGPSALLDIVMPR